MKQFIIKKAKLVTVIFFCLTVGILTMSFQDTPWVSQILDNQKSVDTVPQRRDAMTMKEYDRLMEQLSDVTLSLNNLHMDELNRNLDATLEKIDIDGILATVEKSLSEIDLDKVMNEVISSLKESDVKLSSKEMEEALKESRIEIDEAKQELKQINRDEIKKEIEDARRELAESRKELQDLNIDKIRQEAQMEVSESIKDLRSQREMFNRMESDGLINTKKGFEIDYDKKDLYINGKKQKDRVTRKYRGYFKGETYTIKIDAE